MPDSTVIGSIVGSGPGIIYVETKDGTTIILDRFAAIQRLPCGQTLFRLPSEEIQTITKKGE